MTCFRKALLHQEEANLRARRASLKRQAKAAAREAKNLRQRRLRLMKAGVDVDHVSCPFSVSEAARNLSREDLQMLMDAAAGGPDLWLDSV